MITMINQRHQQQQQQEQKGWQEMQRTCRSGSRRLSSFYIDNLFIILTILLCLIIKCSYCSPITLITSPPNSSTEATPSNESSNYIIQELDTNRQQNGSRKYLIAIISNQKQASERVDDLSEPHFILNNDWSERDKRMSIVSTEHSVSENEIEGHHSTKKPAHHHHATTENFIEIIKTIPTHTNRAKKSRSTTKKAINRRKSATTRRRRELSPHVNGEFDSINNNYLSLSPDIEIIYPENVTLRTLVTSTPTQQTTTITENVSINMHKNVTSNRQIEGGDDDDNEFDYDEEDEEGGGGVGGIIKMLLGPLSNERDDGTYDFSGLMGLVGGLFGPGEDGKGGSDVGSFLGGILSATIGGIAGPNGAPAEKGEAEPEGGAAGGSDSAGFIGGILSSIAASSSASSSGSSGDNDSASGSAGFFSKLVQIKLALLRSVFSIISGLLSSSSQG